MGLLSKLSKKRDNAIEQAQNNVEEFVTLVRVYYESVMAVNLGITNLNFVPDLAVFKRMLKIATQNGKLGVAEKSRVRKILMQEYGLNDNFFKTIDSSVKKCCKNQQDIKSYYILFQGFSNDLLTLTGNMMQWKFQLPLFLKKLLYSMTQKTIHDILTKQEWKDISIQKSAWNIKQYKEKLGLNEEWITDFVYQIVILAKKKNKKKK